MFVGTKFLQVSGCLSVVVITSLASCVPKSSNNAAVATSQSTSSDNATAGSKPDPAPSTQSGGNTEQETLTIAPAEAAKFVVLKGDVNLDGKVDGDDGLALIQAGKFNKDEAATWCQGDISIDDRRVDQNDSSELLAHQGASEVNKTILIGDINMDGKVNSTDVTLFNAAGKFGKAEAATWCEGDFTRDGKVDQADQDAMQANWLKSL
jgi:hypothetical protein